ncbi:hypothetical protein BH23BAC2_BH23BAC2_03360 [soil metagenome]
MYANNQNRENSKNGINQQKKASSVVPEEKPSESNAIQIPQISLPKGGGALKGIDEKFEVNAANGTASFSIPLPLTPGRNNFTPSLSLSYNSGGGNSAFGLGWSLNLPSIQRKTDKALPRYREGSEEDTFMFSGAEDLVPNLIEQADGSWIPPEPPPGEYLVKKYRPRVEGGFARIEKISHPQHGVYWRVTTRDNTTTFFGRSQDCRIADPEDDTRIFEWLPEFSFDNKGNWIRYAYKRENQDGVENTLHESKRINETAPFTNQYLKRVFYGNKSPYFLPDDSNPYDPPQPPIDAPCFFELVIDYGEHHALIPLPGEEEPLEENLWLARSDAFSSYRSGFEIRTYRLCQRVLMFHHFPEEEDFGADYLVRSLKFDYLPSSINNSEQAEVTYLQSITQTGYIRKADGSYSSKSLPPLEFTYQHLNWNTEVKVVDDESIVHAPVGLTNNYQWVDLYGEGISGILTEQAEGWFYKSNLGDTHEDSLVTFTQAQPVIPKPSFTGLASGVLSLQDLEANGKKQVVINSNGLHGFFELSEDNNWKPFTAFSDIPNVDLRDPNTRLIDLNGDGQPELVITEENVFVWYAANGKQGHKPAEFTLKTFDEEQGPAVVFADQEQSIFLADMSGDGMTDIVRIRNEEICYWANKGYGRFSAKVNMSNAPLFDYPGAFNPKYLHLADVSGTGATDIIYTGQNLFKAYINLSGNGWSDAHEIKPFFSINSNTQISVVDLLGTGTSCIVWSSDLPADGGAPMRYIDLMDSKKPHVLIKQVNNLGKETTLHYKSSTHYYLNDKLEGNSWITKLPFPVQVISRMVVEEKVTKVRFSSEYGYHHGYYDHSEREFRGFGMVEQVDTEQYQTWQKNNEGNQLEKSEALYQKPVLTKTWFHTGAFLDRERILNQFEREYWYNEYNRTFPEPLAAYAASDHKLEDAWLVAAQNISNDSIIDRLSAEEWREALRACKGMTLRQEVFALDAPEVGAIEPELRKQLIPFTVATHNCTIQLLQPRSSEHHAQHAVFMVTESEAITYQYERNKEDPRVAHTINVKLDELGNVLESAAIVYPRETTSAEAEFQVWRDKEKYFHSGQESLAFEEILVLAENEQKGSPKIIYTQNVFTWMEIDGVIEHDIIDEFTYRLRLPAETKTYEITGIDLTEGLYQRTHFNSFSGINEIGYHAIPATGPRKRLIEHIQSTYYSDDLRAELPLYTLSALGFPFQSYQLAYTPELLSDIFEDKLPADPNQLENLLSDNDADGAYQQCRFVHRDDANWWIRSGVMQFLNEGEPFGNARDRFLVPLAYIDPFGTVTTVDYYQFLMINRTEDALENVIRVDAFDLRSLSPTRMVDINNNISQILTDELGLVKAMAVMGKGEEADHLTGLQAITTEEERVFITRYFNTENSNELNSLANELLGSATARFVYDFDRYRASLQAAEEIAEDCGKPRIHPTVVGSIMREEHHELNPDSPLQLSFEYTDGFGKVSMAKVQAEPGMAKRLILEEDCSYTVEEINTADPDENTEPQLRWIGNGRTVLNNKGNPVKQYEPYFSVTPWYEDAKELVETGVTPILYYDALGRQVRTELPDGTFTKVEFDAWKQLSYDQNDTVLETDDPAAAGNAWYEARIHGDLGTEEQEAAAKAAKHQNTPSLVFLDTLGRSVLSIAHNRFILGDRETEVDAYYPTFIGLDIEGNVRLVKDARGNEVMTYKYDLLGHRVYQNSMDGGERWMLNTVAGNPLQSWDSRNHQFTYTYDPLQRPLEVHLAGGDDESPFDDIVVERMVYGETLIVEGQSRNLRGQLYQHYNGSGLLTNDRFDFKGNLRIGLRQMPINYDAPAIDWQEGSATYGVNENEIFTQVTEYDAMSRMKRLLNWHRNESDAAVYIPTYNPRGVLASETLTVKGETTTAVSDITYNEKGQRTGITFGNGTRTRYHYEPLTFRLKQLRTTKRDYHPNFPHGQSAFKNLQIVQNLFYRYDPVGNITDVYDDAFEPAFFSNQEVSPQSQYTYDAIYRLIKASGRENSAYNQAPERNENQALTHAFSPVSRPGAIRNYTQHYQYDGVGNILRMRHVAPEPTERWTRNYHYATNSNQLESTQTGGDSGPITRYDYDTHGSMLNLNNTPGQYLMQWDYRDMIRYMDLGGGGNAFYQYDSGKQRTRKRIERNGSQVEERLYLGGMELYRLWRNGTLLEEIETHHLFVDDQRVLLVEDVIQSNHNLLPEAVLYRYQYSNHLGSVGLELNEDGAVISYEEYHPYGTPAYHMKNNGVNATAKRYRYTGMERDEESGLNYHTARYYLPWLGRWMSVDTAGLVDGLNLYKYALNSPISTSDQSGLATYLGYSMSEGQYQTDMTSVAGLSVAPQLPVPTRAVAERQLQAMQEYLRGVGEVQGIELGLTGAELELFSRAEEEALSITEVDGRYRLETDLIQARRGRNGVDVSWVLRRIEYLVRPDTAEVNIITGENVTPPTDTGYLIGSTTPYQGSQHQARSIHERATRVDVRGNTINRKTLQERSQVSLGEALVHELVIHTIRDVLFNDRKHNSDRYSFSMHWSREHGGYSTEHRPTDHEAHMLDYYLRRMAPQEFTPLSEVPPSHRQIVETQAAQEEQSVRILGGVFATRAFLSLEHEFDQEARSFISARQGFERIRQAMQRRRPH